MRVLAGLRNLDALYFVAATLDQSLDIRNDAFDVSFVKPVLRDKNVYLIESRLFAQLGECGEIDVAIDDVLHARLRLADVVNTTADHKGLLDAVRSLHCYYVANVRLRNLKRVAFDQDLARRRRPCTGFWHELADANVPVVLD